MKLRIVDDSVRLRLTRPEVACIARGDTVAGVARFPGESLHYAVGVSEQERITATFAGGRIDVRLPQRDALAWATGNEVSLCREQATASGTFEILVEKDFVCIEPRAGQNPDDFYPNPKAVRRPRQPSQA